MRKKQAHISQKCVVKKVGTVGVDAGAILVSDPAKLSESKEVALTDLLRRKKCAQIGRNWNSSVLCEMGYGDAIYPVYATICGGTVTNVEIRMPPSPREVMSQKLKRKSSSKN